MRVRTISIRSCKRSWAFGRILPTRTVPGSGGPTNIPMDCFGDTFPNGQISETLPRNSSMRHRLNNTPRKVLQYHTPREGLGNDCRNLSKRTDAASSLYGGQPAYGRGQFLCSAAEPVSSPRPALLRRRRAQWMSRLAVAPTLPNTLTLPGHALISTSTLAGSMRWGDSAPSADRHRDQLRPSPH